MRLFISIMLLFGFVISVEAHTIKLDTADVMRWATLPASQDSLMPQIKPKKKGIAITLAITLGVFGVHRLYLGTEPKTPVVYTLTLGGGFGVLMLADIIAIIASEDVNQYSPNNKVFMWAK